ncbi:MAG: LacI family DNA-binding transcriptional regulator [Lachnospiraceae bacterium]|nr:LacI family DNA-binding transcriptional regulator [Lachnospiraceae bacterium]
MTLKDIAEKAGVSMMTVSNVINGKHNRVSAQTIEKVNQIIKECDYVPNLSARSLTSKTSNIIGIIISVTKQENEESYLENPYVSTMIGAIERELRYNGYYTMVRSVTQKEDLNLLLRNWNVNGIIFLYPDSDNLFHDFLSAAPCPIAIFDNYKNYDGVINVCSDDDKGLYLSTKYAINHGHSNIAFVADYEGNPLLTERLNGYKRALEENNIPFRPEYVFSHSPNYEGGIAAGKKIASFSGAITAVVTTADICAAGIIEGARLSGLRIPIDLSVVGYDNLQLCQFTSPKLTSVSQNVRQKALLATRLLLEQIRTGEFPASPHVVMDVEIVERQSVISLF